MSLTIKIFCVATQCLCSDKRSDNSHQIRCTLVSFLSISRFGFDPIGEVKRTAGELSGISMRNVVLLWKVPLVNYFMAASKQQMNKKKAEKRTIRQVDGQTCDADPYYFQLRKKERRGREENLCWGDMCLPSFNSSPPSLHIWGINWCCQTHREGQNTRAHT